MTQLVQMSGAEGEGLYLKRFEEIIFPNLDHVDPERAITYTRDFKYKKGDVILCCYPKVGIHWMFNILWKLKTSDTSKEPPDTSIEYGPPGAFTVQEDSRIMLSSLSPKRLLTGNIEGNAKIVLLLRNPKDVAVSYFHYLKEAAVYKNKQTWEEFFQSFVEGNVPFGSYFAYLKDWEYALKHNIDVNQNKLQIETFFYEDLLLNTKANIGRLNDFLCFGRDGDYLEDVLKETTFEAMRDCNKATRKGTHLTCNDGHGRSVIYRKGTVEDWKSQLTTSQSDVIDKLLQEALMYDVINSIMSAIDRKCG